MNEETLDPKDWSSMAELGHRMVDDMVVTMLLKPSARPEKSPDEPRTP